MADPLQTLLLTASQVEQRTGLSKSTIYDQAAKGTLPHLRIGRAVRFPLAALVSWIKENTVSVPREDAA